MKRFKSALAIAVVAAMTLSVAACSKSDSNDKKKHSKKDSDNLEISFETESVSENSNIAEKTVEETGDLNQTYYDYVANAIIPEIGLSDVDSSLIMAFGSGNFHQQSDFQPKLGLLSADVRDYNGDGVLDLVTYSLSDMPSASTSTGVVMAERWNGYADNFLSVTARFYTFENGVVTFKNQVDSITEMSGDSIGTLIYGVYDDEGSVFIYGSCNTETPETYGPRKTNIYHVEGDSFVFDATQGFYGFGQASVDGDPNVIAGTAGVDFAPTAMGTALTHVNVNVFEDSSVDCNGSVLGGVKVGYYESMNDVEIKLYDLSLLRNVLNSGIGELAARAPMPVFEAPTNIVPEAEANALVDRVTASTGVAFNFDGVTLIDGGGSLLTYSSASNVSLKIRYSADGKLQIIDSTYKSTSPCEDWYTVKDAVFTDAQLAIDPSLYSTFLGHCEWNQMSQSNDNVSITVARMDDCFWTIRFN